MSFILKIITYHNFYFNIFEILTINAIKKLPAAYFKTLQMSFYVTDSDQNFCINNIEFGKVKVKT